MEDDNPVANPLPFYVEQQWDGRFKIGRFSNKGLMASSLKGTYTNEILAKKTIVKFYFKKHYRVKKKSIYKEAGRRTIFKRLSISWKPDYVYGASKTSSTV